MINPTWPVECSEAPFKYFDVLDLDAQLRNGGRADGLETLSTKEVLTLMGISRSGLYRILKSGDFRPRNLTCRGRRYFVKVDVERYLYREKIVNLREGSNDVERSGHGSLFKVLQKIASGEFSLGSQDKESAMTEAENVSADSQAEDEQIKNCPTEGDTSAGGNEVNYDNQQ